MTHPKTRTDKFKDEMSLISGVIKDLAPYVGDFADYHEYTIDFTSDIE